MSSKSFEEWQIEQVINFFQTVERQFSTIRFFHTNKSIKLKDQYISINVTTDKKYKHQVESTLNYPLSNEEINKAYSRGSHEHDSQTQTSKVLSWEEAKKLNQRLIVLADPGMGKTTLLQREALSIAQEQIQLLTNKQSNLDDVIFPIFLSLKQLSLDNSSTDIVDNILKIVELNYRNKARNISKLLRNGLENGKAILLLDSLDEVSKDKRNSLADTLNNFLRNCPCTVICSSRIVGYSNFLDSAKELEIIPFSEKEIEIYIKTWFKNADEHISNKTSAEKMLSELKSKPQVKGLTQIPLMLSLLCSLYQEGDLFLPAKKSQVYQQAVDNILRKWVLKRDSSIDEWEIEDIKQLLTHIAYHMSFNNIQIITASELLNLVKVFIANFPDAFQGQKDPKIILRDLTEKYGILQKLYKDSQHYIFLHRTFQEYFTACYINEEVTKNRSQAEDLIKKLLWQYDWHETLSLLAGVIKDPLTLINLITKEQDDIFSSMFLLACQCLAESNLQSSNIVTNLLDKLYELWLDKKFHQLTIVNNLIVTLGQSYDYLFNVLVNTLSDEDINIYIRKNTATVLGKIKDERAISVLVNILFSKHAILRSAAVKALGDIANENIIPVLLDALSDNKNSFLSNDIIEALRKIGHDKVIPPLLNALSDKNPFLRSAVAYILGELRDPRASSALFNALLDEDESVYNSILKALWKIDNEEAFLFLFNNSPNQDSFLKHSSHNTPRKEVDGLEIFILLRALSKQNYSTRSKAVKVLGQILGKINHEDAFLALVNALSDEHEEVRRNAAEALGNVRNKKAINVLVDALSDEDGLVRSNAAYALGEIGSDNAIFALLKTLTDKLYFVRVNVIRALEKIKAKEIIPTLVNSLSDENHFVRSTAIEALGEVEREKAIPILVNLFFDKDYTVRMTTAEVLGKIRSKQAIPNLANALSDEHPLVRSRVIEALGNIGGKKAVEILADALSDKDCIYDVAKALNLNAEIDSLENILKNPLIDKFDPTIFNLIRNLAIKFSLILKQDENHADFIPVYADKIVNPL